jgi:LysM repeat protein
MKSLAPLAFLLIFSGRIFGAEPEIELRGVMTGGGPTKLSLADRQSGTTQWVEVGKTFAGLTVKSYDPKTETALMLKDGQEYRLRLNTAKIADATEAAPAVAAEVATKIQNNLRQIVAAADQYFLETGKERITIDELVGPEKYIKRLDSVSGEDYSALAVNRPKTSEPPQLLSVVTSTGQLIQVEIPSPAQPPMQTVSEAATHAVRPGDTAAKIAENYNLEVNELRALNPGVDFARLKVGQNVKLK